MNVITTIPPQVVCINSRFEKSRAYFDLTPDFINNKPKKALWTSNLVDPLECVGWIDHVDFLGNRKNLMLEWGIRTND